MLVEIMKINKEDAAVVTSLDIAETFGKRHADVLRDIKALECSKEFTQRNFALTSYKDASGKSNKKYLLTKDGFTMLVMGYTGEKAMKFKEGYIRQFNAMEKALIGKIKEREKGVAVRQALTRAVQQAGENDRMHRHAYSIYTNVIYKAIFGKNAKQLREKYGITEKDSLRDCFSEDELQLIQSKEMLVSGLIGCGWGYEQIKSFILQNNAISLAG